MKVLKDVEFITKFDSLFKTTRWYKLYYLEDGKEKSIISYGSDYVEASNDVGIFIPWIKKEV